MWTRVLCICQMIRGEIRDYFIRLSAESMMCRWSTPACGSLVTRAMRGGGLWADDLDLVTLCVLVLSLKRFH
jgi:hypothetical protein